MGTNIFTQEQQEQLLSNPYVIKVSKTSITYSEEFKDIFYQEYTKGRGPSEILSELGFDPKVLGKSRRKNLVQRIKNCALRSSGYKDMRGQNSGRPKQVELSPGEELAQLKLQNEILKQEVDFLRKKERLDREAEWRSRRQSKTIR